MVVPQHPFVLDAASTNAARLRRQTIAEQGQGDF
jgi:hypothetical protein